jgi:integrase
LQQITCLRLLHALRNLFQYSIDRRAKSASGVRGTSHVRACPQVFSRGGGAEKIIEKYRRLSGITKRFSCHSLRHTFGSYKAEQGVSPFQLKEWMGHSSIAVTQLYVHLGKESARRAMEQTSL